MIICVRLQTLALLLLLLLYMSLALQTLALLLLLVPGLAAYPHYQEQIPNGDRIPHPCKANYVWQGVGHRNKNGGGMRNRFGEDFAKNGHVSAADDVKPDSCMQADYISQPKGGNLYNIHACGLAGVGHVSV
jgi:hypothetical protein